MHVDQRLLDQQPTHAVAEEQNRPRLDPVSLDPDGLEQLARLLDKCASVPPVDCGRVVLVQEDARLGDGLRKIIAEPEASLRSGRSAPGIPRVDGIVLASRVQAVDGNDAGTVP